MVSKNAGRWSGSKLFLKNSVLCEYRWCSVSSWSWRFVVRRVRAVWDLLAVLAVVLVLLLLSSQFGHMESAR